MGLSMGMSLTVRLLNEEHASGFPPAWSSAAGFLLDTDCGLA